MRKMHALKVVAAGLVLLCLSACGGGGAKTDPTPPQPQSLTWDSGNWDNSNWS